MIRWNNDKKLLNEINKKFQSKGIIILGLIKMLVTEESIQTKGKCILEYLKVINKKIQDDQSQIQDHLL